MTMKNTENSYGKVSKILHWGMFLLIAGMLGVGLYMADLPKETPEELRYKIDLIQMHKAMGIIILFLIVLRFIWRVKNPVPKMPEGTGFGEKLMAHGGHLLLYAMVFILPLTGWMMSSAGGHKVSIFGLFTMPSLMEKNKSMSGLYHELHEVLAMGLIALIILHVIFALYHHMVKKDDILTRMMPSHGKKDDAQ